MVAFDYASKIDRRHFACDFFGLLWMTLILIEYLVLNLIDAAYFFSTTYLIFQHYWVAFGGFKLASPLEPTVPLQIWGILADLLKLRAENLPGTVGIVQVFEAIKL